MGGAELWTVTGDGVRLRVRLTPKSARDAIEGLAETAEGSALQARVRAAPEEGAANAALGKLIARWLGVPKTTVTLLSGTRSRIKTLVIRGAPAELGALIAKRLAELD